MDIEMLKKYITFTKDKVIIDNDFYEKVLAPSMDNAIKFKQQLISFLKNLIEETECAYDYKENDYKNSGKWNLLNEILDFVNKGGKDE